MVESKAWNWEMVPKDDKYWNSPDQVIYYLKEQWQEKGFKDFLDIGCGFGRHALYMARNNFNVSGFDLSEFSVQTVAEKAEKENLKITLQVSDMLEMPYEDNSFDCALAMNVISHTDTIGFKKILNEIKRILKPGGEVYFTLGSKDSYWYNKDLPVVDENTKIRVEDGPENGIPHFYVNDDDCLKLFNDFIIVGIRYIKELTEHGSFSPHYHVHLKKRND